MNDIDKEEANAFQAAAVDFVAHPNSALAIEAMMRLATGAQNPTRRQWASNWLTEHCGISVVHPEEKGQGHAASTEANIIR